MSTPLDLIILGAGPAGIAAYQTAKQCGLTLALVDENPHPGGRIYKGITRLRASRYPLNRLYGPEGTWAAKSIAEMQDADDVLTGHTVIDLGQTDDDLREIYLLGKTGMKLLRARRILVATGAKERPFPFPGWTLQGVITAGAIQMLMKDNGCLPDCPVVLAGSGPLLLLLATQLAEQEVAISALLDTTPPCNVFRAAPYLPGAALAGSAVWQGLGLLRQLRRRNVRHIRGITSIEAYGTDRLTSVSFTVRGRQQRMDCAMLIIHQGIVPDTQLTRQLGCNHRWSHLLQGWVPEIDGVGQTSQDCVSVAGDVTGSNGALAARNSGQRAALDAACKLNAISPRDCRDRMKALHARQSRLDSERRFLNRLFAPGQHAWRSLPDTTVLCRCEEVSFGRLRDMARTGIGDFDHFKALTRCGMGPCQGRICADMAAMALAEEAGVDPDDVRQMRVRSPLKPVPLKVFAEGADIDEPLQDADFVYTRETP